MRNLFYLKNKKNHFYGQDLGLNWQTIIAKSKKLILNNWNGNPSLFINQHILRYPFKNEIKQHENK